MEKLSTEAAKRKAEIEALQAEKEIKQKEVFWAPGNSGIIISCVCMFEHAMQCSSLKICVPRSHQIEGTEKEKLQHELEELQQRKQELAQNEERIAREKAELQELNRRREEELKELEALRKRSEEIERAQAKAKRAEEEALRAKEEKERARLRAEEVRLMSSCASRAIVSGHPKHGCDHTHMILQDRIRAALEFEAKKAQQEMEKERKKRQVFLIRVVQFVHVAQLSALRFLCQTQSK